MKKIGLSAAVLVLWVSLTACEPQGTAPQSEVGQDRQVFIPSEPIARDSDARKLRFLNSVREADPEYKTIERAVMNAQNELGIILSRNVAMDDIPRLMRSLLKRMASEFRGQDLTIVAYAPADPPLKIGTARLDASTREMTYTPTQR